MNVCSQIEKIEEKIALRKNSKIKQIK